MSHTARASSTLFLRSGTVVQPHVNSNSEHARYRDLMTKSPIYAAWRALASVSDGSVCFVCIGQSGNTESIGVSTECVETILGGGIAGKRLFGSFRPSQPELNATPP
jgi:hypothetical protein